MRVTSLGEEAALDDAAESSLVGGHQPLDVWQAVVSQEEEEGGLVKTTSVQKAARRAHFAPKRARAASDTGAAGPLWAERQRICKRGRRRGGEEAYL